jgi:tripartite-type tricarboxylate transporter receptor subunit TctC
MKKVLMVFFMLCMVFSGINAMAADSFPTRSIEITIGFGPGGGTDLGARMVAEHSKASLGVDVVCLNKPGGAGRVAATLMSKGKNDGYSLTATTDGPMIAKPHLEDVTYNINDFTFLCQYGILDFAVSVVPDSPFKTLKDLIDFARKNPDELTIGIVGVNTSDHIAWQALCQFENLKIKFVPFKGAATTITGLLGGHVMAATTAASGYAPHVKSGTLRLLASYSEERLEQHPDVPTFKEQGYPYMLVQSWYILYGPKGMETPVVDKLIGAFKKAINTPEYIKFAKDLEVYANKPVFGEDLKQLLIRRYQDNGALYKKIGLIK